MNIKALLSIGKQIKDKCPDIKHIDIYNSQYTPSIEGLIKQFAKPAVLIEFGQTQWTDESNGVQEGDGLLRIHIVLQKFTDTFKIFDKTDGEKATMLAHYLIPKSVQAALQDFVAEGTLSAMDRINTIPDHDFDNIIVEVFEYTFRDMDDAADTLKDWITIQLNDVVAQPTVE